jgi:NAD(P)-dependent dehydrogenase (short-subunit alcohol dehydrogenase family)
VNPTAPFGPDDRSLVGRVAVVTGASRGLGAGMAARFAEAGLRLGLCATHEPLPPSGGPDEALCAPVDVSDPTAVEAFADAVVERFGPIDLWVNNAGILDPIGPHRTLDPALVSRALAVNIGGVDNGTRAFTRRAQDWPSADRVLVNVSSGASRSVYAGWSIYGATKAAVDHLTEIVDAEEADIVCRSIAPGVIDTDMQAHIRAQDEVTFPAVTRFHELARTGAWNSSAWIADHVLALVTGAWATDDVVIRVPDEPR